MRRARYSDKALSTILFAHANGLLVRGGRNWFSPVRGSGGCINQFAFNEPWFEAAMVAYGKEAQRVSFWFDGHYNPDMTPEELLAAIETARTGR